MTTTQQRAKVVLDYEPVTPSEIRLKQGDIVSITRKATDDWFEGENTSDPTQAGFYGYIAVMCVQVLADDLQIANPAADAVETTVEAVAAGRVTEAEQSQTPRDESTETLPDFLTAEKGNGLSLEQISISDVRMDGYLQASLLEPVVTNNRRLFVELGSNAGLYFYASDPYAANGEKARPQRAFQISGAEVKRVAADTNDYRITVRITDSCDQLLLQLNASREADAAGWFEALAEQSRPPVQAEAAKVETLRKSLNQKRTKQQSGLTGLVVFGDEVIPRSQSKLSSIIAKADESQEEQVLEKVTQVANVGGDDSGSQHLTISHVSEDSTLPNVVTSSSIVDMYASRPQSIVVSPSLPTQQQSAAPPSVPNRKAPPIIPGKKSSISSVTSSAAAAAAVADGPQTPPPTNNVSPIAAVAAVKPQLPIISPKKPSLGSAVVGSPFVTPAASNRPSVSSKLAQSAAESAIATGPPAPSSFPPVLEDKAALAAAISAVQDSKPAIPVRLTVVENVPSINTDAAEATAISIPPTSPPPASPPLAKSRGQPPPIPRKSIVAVSGAEAIVAAAAVTASTNQTTVSSPVNDSSKVTAAALPQPKTMKDSPSVLLMDAGRPLVAIPTTLPISPPISPQSLPPPASIALSKLPPPPPARKLPVSPSVATNPIPSHTPATTPVSADNVNSPPVGNGGVAMPSKPQAPEETAAAAISHVSPTTKPVVLVPPAKPARLATPTRIVSDDSIVISAPVAFDHQEETNGKQLSAAEPTTLSIPSNHPLAPARKRLNVSEQKLSQDAGSGTNIGSTQKLVEQLENRDNGHARSASVDSPATAESPRLQVVAAKPAVGSGSVAKLANPQLAAVLASSPKTPLSPPRPRLQSNSSQNVTASDSENEDAKTQGAFRPQLAEILGRGKPSLSLPTAESVEVSADDVSISNIEYDPIGKESVRKAGMLRVQIGSRPVWSDYYAELGQNLLVYFYSGGDPYKTTGKDKATKVFSVAGSKIEVTDRRKFRFSLTTLTKRVILLQALGEKDMLGWTGELSAAIGVRIIEALIDQNPFSNVNGSTAASPAAVSMGRKADGIPSAAVSVLPVGPVSLTVLNRNKSASNKFIQDVRPEELPTQPPTVEEELPSASVSTSPKSPLALRSRGSSNALAMSPSLGANEVSNNENRQRPVSQQSKIIAANSNGNQYSNSGREYDNQQHQQATEQYQNQQSDPEPQQLVDTSKAATKKKKNILQNLMGLLGKLKRATSRSKDELRGNPDQQEQRQELALPQQAPITPISIFGGSLEAQAQKQNSLVPRIVLECIQIIEQKGMNIEGIYRLSGNNGSMQRLRFFYNNYENFWIDPNYEDWSDVHVITGALKLYFRELQNPLITFAMYDKFIAVASALEDENEKIQTLRRLVRELPPPNGATLALLSRHLNRVSAHSDVNKMNSKVLAIVFGPTLFRQQVETIETITNMNFQNSILEMLISKVEEIFS